MQSFFELGSLFVTAFFAASILPAFSELTLVELYRSGHYTFLILILVATAGNTLGAVLNWYFGKYLLHFKDRKWFPVKEKSLDKATKLFQKYGVWSLLFAWMPVFGDPLTVVAGIFRVRWWEFLILVAIGKSVRYIAILELIR